jgi:hypothetical protein
MRRHLESVLTDFSLNSDAEAMSSEASAVEAASGR